MLFEQGIGPNPNPNPSPNPNPNPSPNPNPNQVSESALDLVPATGFFASSALELVEAEP